MKKEVDALVPTSRVPKTLTAGQIDRLSRPITALETALGGRDAFVAALAIHASPDTAELLSLLTESSRVPKTLGRIAHDAGVGLSMLLRAYHDGMLTKAHLIATTAAANHLLSVVEDILKRSVPYDEACTTCYGTGELRQQEGDAIKTIVCGTCHGHKLIAHVPDLDYQKLALQLAEFIKPDKASTIIQSYTNTFAGPAQATFSVPSLEQQQQVFTDRLYGRSAVPLDLEVPPEPSVSD